MDSDEDKLREVDERLAQLLEHDTSDETGAVARQLKTNQLVIRTITAMGARIARLEARVRELENGA